jgi:hypothetical protein
VAGPGVDREVMAGDSAGERMGVGPFVWRQVETIATDNLLPLPPNANHYCDESDAAHSEHQDKHRADKNVRCTDEPEKCLLSHGGPPSDSVAEGAAALARWCVGIRF